MKRSLHLFVILLLPIVLFGQERYNELYREKVKLNNGQIVDRINFSTKSNLDNFYQSLCKDFGQPVKNSLSWNWDNLVIKDFSNDTIRVKISVTFVNGREDNWKKVSITAENLNRETILKPRTKTYNKIKRYFEQKINETII